MVEHDRNAVVFFKRPSAFQGEAKEDAGTQLLFSSLLIFVKQAIMHGNSRPEIGKQAVCPAVFQYSPGLELARIPFRIDGYAQVGTELSFQERP